MNAEAPIARPAQSSALEVLRFDRDRFVAFAFAGADALVETDMQGIVMFAAGALHAALACTADQLIDRSLYDVLPLGERPKLRALLTALQEAGRVESTPLNIGEHGIIVAAAMIPERRERAYLAVRLLADSEVARSKAGDSPKLIDRARFSTLAAEALKSRTPSGGQFHMSFVSANGLSELAGRLDKRAAADLQSQITATVQRHAGSADAAARLSADGFSFIHQAEMDLAHLSQDMERIGKRKDPTGKGLQIEYTTVDLAADSGHEDASAQALLYAVNSFAEGRPGFTVRDLGKGAKALVGETVQRMNNFRSTIIGGRFEIALQPIVALKDRAVHHYEALVRFDAEVSPFDAIQFAEKVGLIADFDLAMIQKVLTRLSKERASGAGAATAINISGRSLESPAFLTQLHNMLKQFDMLKGKIIFELTESSEIRDLPRAAAAIDRLRSSGYPVCLDDFGSGAAAFHYLRALNVDFVKIDGAYVKDVLSSPRQQPFLAAMVQLCRALKIATIGEMIETEETARYLLEVGVDYGQGYLFGRPSPRPM
jgi:EAL domain-containing protein (putative c-di-GMP-specific phosphodiesterase class I)